MPNPPVVVSYVASFLKPEQIHVYRQMLGLRFKVDVHVFTHRRENTERFGYVEKWVHTLPKSRLRWWRRFLYRQVLDRPWQLYRWEVHHWLLNLARVDAKVVHFYFGHVGPHFLPLLRVMRQPSVLSFHGADAAVDMHKPHYRAAMKEVFQLITAVQCRSEALRRDVEALGCPPEKITIHRTGIVAEHWPYREWQAPEDGAWQLMQSGRFIAKKGLDLTLKAFAQVRAAYPKAHLTLVGDGPLREALEQQARELGIADAITWTGFVRQGTMCTLVKSTHIFLHPSRTAENGDREGVPNAMLEAMSAGLAVVATHHGGIPEAITDGESGLLVPENDAPALGAALLRLLGDPALAAKLGRAGHASVKRDYDRATQDEKLATYYKDLIARVSSGG